MINFVSNKFIKFSKSAWFYTAVRLTLAIAAGVAIQYINLDYFEYLTYDWRVRYRSAPTISNKVAIISIDKKTVRELGYEIPAETHQQLLTKLIDAKVKSATYPLNEKDIVPIYGEVKAINELSQYIKDKAVYLGKDAGFNPSDLAKARLKEPFQNFKTLPAPVTKDENGFAKDRVTRRAVISFDGIPSMHTSLAQSVSQTPVDNVFRGEFDYYTSKQVLINFRQPGSYQRISFIDVLNNKYDVNQLAGKIVLIGDESNTLLENFVTNPYHRGTFHLNRLELHANILDTLIANNAPVKTPNWLRLLLTCLVSALTVFVVLKLRPSNGLVVIILTLVSIFGLGFSLFAGANFFLSIAHPLLAVFICYYFFIPYRLIVENRKSWEYYHKNRLLTQVEELKSNFMRMMSHDLKTPLARIQGMTDIVKREQNLNPEQNKALKTISDSSEELTEFIGSILSLGRIESKEIKLSVQSKDINAIMEKVITKCNYQAQYKNIQIITEFEPLFSVQVDEDLIKQVFTNLIENAIKYSPENSKILISSEEDNGKVLVQVADQGIGIAKQEQDQVFSKFYRSRSVTNGPIKGSGLGLYLANYFVNLHSGKIQIESEPNKGSTFTVELPVE